MSIETVDRVVSFIETVPMVNERVPVVWHAGEPMVVPRSHYAAAFERFRRLVDRGITPVHNFQTNATLITDAWCEFIREHHINVGVSIDGPQAVHDLHRQDRAGRGTFDRVSKGMRLLKQHEIEFSVIVVLTRDSLARFAELMQFFDSQAITSIGFNVDEIEGRNTTSTMNTDDAEDLSEAFFESLFEYQEAHPTVRIREIADTVARLASRSGRPVHSSENAVGSILNFSHTGKVSTFSPELLTTSIVPPYRSFTWGDVRVDTYSSFLDNLAASPEYRDIAAGVANCAGGCEYFGVCGGGAPSNKVSELGTFAGTETLSCRLQVQALSRAVLRGMERRVRNPRERRSAN